MSMRIIARLDVKGPNVVKGVQFEALRVIGKPADLARKYFLQGADELMYIDTVASLYRRENLLHIVREASKSIFIPFTAGGGVRTIEDIHGLLQSGAEKVAINTAAVKNPEFIKEAAQRFGSQCTVLSIEAKRRGDSWEVYTDNGREATGLDVIEWARRAESLGAGEILLTSVDREGTERGLDVGLIKKVSTAVSVPVIASGGASSPTEIANTMVSSDAEAVAIASLLHYGRARIAEIKDALTAAGVPIRPCTEAERAQPAPVIKEADVTDYNRFTLRQFGENIGIENEPKSDMELPQTSPEEADVVIIDYGINNVRSVAMACESFGKKVSIAHTPEDIRVAKRLILPGVGAFGDGMHALREKKFIEPILAQIKKGTPFLGICLGMQLLFSQSEEFGTREGLGVVEGNVVMFPDPRTVHIPGYHLPHIGWDAIRPPVQLLGRWQQSVLEHTRPGEYAYFVHSLHGIPADESYVLAVSSYGGINFCTALQHNNITATQFHPEKSGMMGLALLQRFCEQSAT